MHTAKRKENKMKNYQADAVIVGAGPSGMSAALELGAAGCHVIILEKEGKAGGLREGGIGPFGVESFVQQSSCVNLTKEDAFNYFMDFTHWKTDARLVSEYINLSADTIEWLNDMGVKFTGVSAYYVGGKPTQHNIDMSGPKITQVMYEKSKEYPGLDFKFNTAGKHLLKENGSVVGIEAETSKGEPFRVYAKAVIVCSGGFAGDPEMVSRVGYTKNKDLFYTFEMPDLTGDGIKMIWEAGGAKAPMMMDTYIGLPHGYGGPMGTAPALAGLRQYSNLMVNRKGQRFMREDLMKNPSFAGNAVHRQKDGCAIMILDGGLYERYQKQEAAEAKHRPAAPPLKPGEKPQPFERFHGTMEEIMKEAIASGNRDFYIADSIEELAQQADLPVDELKKTLEEYNGLCRNKEDSIFHKDPRYLQPITGPRYYAARFCCDTYGGLGGVKINSRTQVLNENEDPIPGLYAAGNDANTIYGDSYPFYLCGNTSGFAFNSGRMAGRNAAKDIRSGEKNRA